MSSSTQAHGLDSGLVMTNDSPAREDAQSHLLFLVKAAAGLRALDRQAPRDVFDEGFLAPWTDRLEDIIAYLRNAVASVLLPPLEDLEAAKVESLRIVDQLNAWFDRTSGIGGTRSIERMASPFNYPASEDSTAMPNVSSSSRLLPAQDPFGSRNIGHPAYRQIEDADIEMSHKLKYTLGSIVEKYGRMFDQFQTR